mgnify:FL=1
MFKFMNKQDGGIVSPIDGKCINIEDVPDKVFSTRMMGDGFAIIPSDNIVVSPVDGIIVMIPNSKHAFGIKTRSGVEILVHVGLDTVNLKGRGFETFVKVGDKVKKNMPILKFDANIMDEMNIDKTTMVIFTAGYNQSIKLECYDREVHRGDTLIK